MTFEKQFMEFFEKVNVFLFKIYDIYGNYLGINYLINLSNPKKKQEFKKT